MTITSWKECQMKCLENQNENVEKFSESTDSEQGKLEKF